MLEMRPVATTEPASGDEKTVVERAQNGDMGAFDTLIQRYQDQVYSVAYRLVGNEDDAADVAQEVFLAFFRYIGSYRGDSKLSTWLYRITVNMAKNLWSRQKRQGYEVTESLDDPRDDDPDSPAPVEMLADPAPNPRHRAAGSEIVGVIERKLQEIEPEFREAIVLRFIEGLSYEEIAEVTKEPLGTVKSRIFRARKALKDRMKDYLKEI
jgi:RNA polymerase sigma-70 factor (ECF subfamily)